MKYFLLGMPQPLAASSILTVASATPLAAAGTLNATIKAVGQIKVTRKLAAPPGFTRLGIKLDQESVATEKTLGLATKKWLTSLMPFWFTATTKGACPTCPKQMAASVEYPILGLKSS